MGCATLVLVLVADLAAAPTPTPTHTHIHIGIVITNTHIIQLTILPTTMAMTIAEAKPIIIISGDNKWHYY